MVSTEIPEHVFKCNLQIIDFRDIHDLIAYRNCKFGTIPVLPCSIGLDSKSVFLDTVEYDSKITGLSKEEVVILLRDEVLKRLLGDDKKSLE